MALDIVGILGVVTDHALASGYFDRVGTHEPKNPPGLGLTAAVWVDKIVPVQSSGLASASVLLVLHVRLYTSMLQEPQDQIDPNLTLALDALFGAYIGDFELGGLARSIDIFGAAGTALSAQAGYLNQDGQMYRVFTVTLPIIVNDVWTEA